MTKYRIKQVTRNSGYSTYIPQKLHFGIFWIGWGSDCWDGRFGTEQQAKDHIDSVIRRKVKTTTYKDYP